MRWSVLLVLLSGAIVGAALPGVAAADHRHPVTVEGVVYAPDGEPASDATLLVGESGSLTERSPAELRDAAAADLPDLTVVDVGPDGRYEATVPYDHAEAAVAVTDTRVSDLRWIRRENRTLDVQLYDRRPQTVYAHLGAVEHDQRRDELLVSLVNNDDATVENLSLTVDWLPPGWSVAGARTNGTYDPESRTLTWASVAPGEEVDTEVVLAVPADVAPGEYTVGLSAGSDTHRVDVEDETVEVLPEDTPGPTTMPTATATPPSPTTTAGADAGTTRGNRPTSVTPTPTSDVTGPGFGALAAVAALASLALLLRRR